MKNDLVVCKAVSRRKGQGRTRGTLAIISVLKCTEWNGVNGADGC